MDTSFEGRLRLALRPTERGVVGLVDQILDFGRAQGAVIECLAGRCVCRPLEGAGEAVEFPLPKAALRTVLARVAALCNEFRPGSVSPYGGEGQVVTASDPAAPLRVAFTNTTAQQRLEVGSAATIRPAPPTGGGVPAAVTPASSAS